LIATVGCSLASECAPMRRRPEHLASALRQLDQAARRRSRAVVSGFESGNDSAPTVVVDGQSLRNFCSNDYLGLARHPELATAAARAAAEFGSGSGASHLVCGHSTEHHALEVELATFLGRERALLFSTGYMANLGVISALTARGEVILADRLNHASLVDGARLSAAQLQRYAHNDLKAATQLFNAQPNTSLLTTDGVFSMDGDVAPLAALATLCRERECWLMVDDAHGIGVLGNNGGGSVQVAGLNADDVPLLVGTLGKAFGSFGAFVAGDADLIEYLMQHARSYIYTTALPPAVAAASRAALRLVQSEPWRRTHLAALVTRFRAGAKQLVSEHGDVALLNSATPIQPLIVGAEQRALQLSARLRARGFWVSAIRPPTVPPQTSRLRITFSAAHRASDVDDLLAALALSLRELAALAA
jgi:8-amino-7-oxononanoate synthase